MKINFTSVKALDRFLAKMGLSLYGSNKLRNEIEVADDLDYFVNKMQKRRILDRINSLEKTDTVKEKAKK